MRRQGAGRDDAKCTSHTFVACEGIFAFSPPECNSLRPTHVLATIIVGLASTLGNKRIEVAAVIESAEKFYI